MDPIAIRVTADTEDAVEAIASVVRAARDLERATTTSVERAAQKIGELNKKYAEVSATIEADKKRVEELNQAKEKASADEKNRIEQELFNLNRITQGREIELLKINDKRIRLEEVGKIAIAASEDEIQFIRFCTQERLIENNVLRDTARAQMNIKDAADESTTSVSRFINGFAGLVSVTTAMTALADQFRKSREQADAMVEAAEKLRNLSAGVFSGDQGALNALGLQGDDQATGQNVISGIQDRFRLKRGTITSTLQSLAPILKDRGVSYDSAQGQELTGQAALLKERGLGDKQIANLIADNPNASPQELAQLGADAIAAMGSPQEANEFLATYQENKPKYDAVGLSYTDVLKAGVATNRMGDRAARQTTLKQLGAGLDRLVGKNPSEYLATFRSLGNYEHGEDKLVSASDPVGSQFNELKRFSGIPEVVPFFDDAIHGKEMDYKGLFKVIAGLDTQKQERLAKAIGGNRNAVAFLATAASGNVSLPKGTLSQSPTNAGYQSEVDKQRADAEAMSLDSAEGANANEAIKAEMNRLSHHPEELTWLASTDRGLPFTDILLKPQVRQQAQANVSLRRMIDLAKLRENVDSGRVKMSALDSSRLNGLLTGLNQSLQGSNIDTDTSDPELNVLANGNDLTSDGLPLLNDPTTGKARITKTRAQLLEEIEHNRQRYIENKGLGSVDDLSGQFTKDRAFIDRLNAADKLLHPSPRPATRPTTQPISMNYHSVNFNYAYPYSDLGNVLDTDNRLG
jgi:hypothetical protein